MRLGVSLRSAHGGDAAGRTVVERAAAARAAGLDSLFVGEHHAVRSGYLQNSPLLGRLLVEWGDRTVGALYLAALWNPVLLAEQVATLAALAAGPFVMQCAVGNTDQFAALGVPAERRGARFEATLRVVRQLLDGETVTTEDPVSLDGVAIGPIPTRPVAVWIGGHAPAAIDRAARLGEGWIAGPGATTEAAARLAETYLSRCAAHGRTPGTVAIRRDIHVGADRAEAEAVVGPAVAAGYRGLDPSALVYGSTADVAERLAELGRLGYTDVLIRHIAEDQRQVLASTARLAEVRAAIR